MNIRVDELKQAGPAYARLRRQRGLPPYKGRIRMVAGAHTPVTVVCGGARYGLYTGAVPAPARA